ncbi:GH92 family glycosyl hydrolase, partial [Acidobacteriota bacterium]
AEKNGFIGYHYSDDTVFGFSHTHLSGTNQVDYGDILLMPTVGPITIQQGSAENTESGYCSKFNHDKETASPGFYRTWLDDYSIDVQLTATQRVGFHKYTFPQTENANVVLDLTHGDTVLESSVFIPNATEIEGFRRSSAWAKDQVVYFVARFSKPFSGFGCAVEDKLEDGLNRAEGRNIKAYVRFVTENNEDILVKVGISAVSIGGARKNLDAEIKDWDFTQIQSEAEEQWNSILGKISVEGKNRDQKKIFYTALYHTLLCPNLYSDVDGSYRGTDLKIHQTDEFEVYTAFPLWETFRAKFPLFTIIEPERSVHFIKTFLSQYEHKGILPTGELAGNNTGYKIGNHTIPVIVDAYIKGIRDYDEEKAYTALKLSAEQDRQGLKVYKKLGYIPGSEEIESVSKTLEYAYDDWCLSQMAKALSQTEDYKHYLQRAQSYKNIFDPGSGFMRAKENGSWSVPFDPLEVSSFYTDANAWQYSFFVPHDVEGLISLMGGKIKFSEKLEKLFALNYPSGWWKGKEKTETVGLYIHENVSGQHSAYLYNFVNQPWITQQKVWEIMRTFYSLKPDGLSGNDSFGQFSAWYVLSALGFYPVCPGRDEYIIGTPLFPKVTIDVGAQKRLVLKAKNISSYNIYIQEMTLNGRIYDKSFLKHSELLNGGEILFSMGRSPNKQWGNSTGGVPGSTISENLIHPVPYVKLGETPFFESTLIILETIRKESKIYYTLNGREPTLQSMEYTGPFYISESANLKMFAVQEGQLRSPTVTARFDKKEKDFHIPIYPKN